MFARLFGCVAIQAERSLARCASGSSSSGSFGAPATTKSAGRFAGGARFPGLGATAGAGAGGDGTTATGLRPLGRTDDPTDGGTSSGPPLSRYGARSSEIVIVGA